MKKAATRSLFGAEFTDQYLFHNNSVGNQLKVILFINEQQYDITNAHNIVSQDPYLIGVEFAYNMTKEDVIRIEIRSGQTQVASATGQFYKAIQGSTVTWSLIEIKNIVNKSISRLRFWLLISYFYITRNNPTSRYEIRCFSMFYMLPRRTFLFAMKMKNTDFLFPIDLLGFSHDGMSCILGIRNSNKSLEHITPSNSICLASFDFEKKEMVFELASKGILLQDDKVNIDFLKTKINEIKLPAFISNYYEFQVESTNRSKSHTIILCKKSSEDRTDINSESGLYIQHMMARFINSRKK